MEEPQKIWQCLLDVNEPWSVSHFKVERAAKRVDVWIGIEMPRSWFGLGRGRGIEQHRIQTWRHTNMGEWRFFLHVSTPPGAELDRYSWAGETGMPFTRALARKIFSLFNEGASLRGICSLLNLPLSDVWRYRFALDNGKLAATQPVSVPPSGTAEAPVDAALTSASHAAALEPTLALSALLSEGGGDSAIPDVSDPVWLQLIEGRLNLDIRVLSLKLLLTRARSQFDVIVDDEVRMLKLRELHRYFEKNERMLGHELSQLRGDAP